MKKTNKIFALLLVLIVLIPFINVHAAESRTVTSESALLEALKDENVTSILLGKDIDTTQKINITRPVTIDGGGHTMRYTGKFGNENSSENTVWGGIYVIQVYKTTATIKDIKLTGGNAALLVNGSNVTLVGKIDVSGNGFGGIELGQGSSVEDINHLIIDDAKIVNDTESEDKPTLWVPSDSDPAIIEKDGESQAIASGVELALNELEEYFEEQESPATFDNLGLLTATCLFGLFGLGINYKKLNA